MKAKDNLTQSADIFIEQLFILSFYISFCSNESYANKQTNKKLCLHFPTITWKYNLCYLLNGKIIDLIIDFIYHFDLKISIFLLFNGKLWIKNSPFFHHFRKCFWFFATAIYLFHFKFLGLNNTINNMLNTFSSWRLPIVQIL